MNDGKEINLKVALIGESGVGKTSIISRYVNNTFRNNFIPTLAANYSNKTVVYKEYNKKVKFELWDTLGQEKYRSMNKIFYKDANAAIIVYDVTRNESFEQIKNYWYQELIDKLQTKEPIIILCANKADLIEYQDVSESISREYAQEKKMIYKETSSKLGAKYINPSFDEEPDLKLKNNNSILNKSSSYISNKSKSRRVNNNIINRELFSSTILDSTKNKDTKKDCKC